MGGFDGWDSVRLPAPPKPSLLSDIVAGIDQRQRQDDRKLSDRSSTAARVTTDGWSLSDTWTGDLTGGVGGFSESVDAAAGIWIFSISATITSTGSGWTGLTDLVLSIGTTGDYHQDHSGLTRTYRLTEPATINLVAATLGGAIASGSVYWSASKIGEVG